MIRKFKNFRLGYLLKQLARKEIYRRYFYVIFRRKYIEDRLKQRNGRCKICGCCGAVQIIICKHFDMETNMCLLWKDKGFDALPLICRIYPFDEKDKCEYSHKNCGYYWEDNTPK